MKEQDYRVPPFTYFGRKHKVAEQIWTYFGDDVKRYAEPFAGSLSVYLKRPAKYDKIIARLNDIDALIINFWRSVRVEPEWIADWCTRPVNEIDLMACHLRLVENKPNITKKIMADPDYYDRELAAMWVFGINCWIGSGWCHTHGPWIRDPETNEVVNKKDVDIGIASQKPNSGFQGILEQTEGVKKCTAGHRFQGILSQAEGVISRKPNSGFRGILSQTTNNSAYIAKLNRNVEWLQYLADSLMTATICCGDWRRIVTNSYTTEKKKDGTGILAAVFLDPPYDKEQQSSGDNNYYKDDGKFNVSAEVRKWCIDNGNDPLYRIVLCGYNDEHDELLAHGWSKAPWGAKQGAGYKKYEESKRTEYFWISPHCVK